MQTNREARDWNAETVCPGQTRSSLPMPNRHNPSVLGKCLWVRGLMSSIMPSVFNSSLAVSSKANKAIDGLARCTHCVCTIY